MVVIQTYSVMGSLGIQCASRNEMEVACVIFRLVV